ncbi:hypothetical protein ES702_00454 [subsurface metagenome]
MSEIIVSFLYLVIFAILDTEITRLGLSHGLSELNEYMSDYIKQRGPNVMYLLKLPAILFFTMVTGILYLVNFKYFWLPYIILGSVYLGGWGVTLLNWLHYKEGRGKILQLKENQT